MAIARQDLARREASFHCVSCNNWIGSNVEKVRISSLDKLEYKRLRLVLEERLRQRRSRKEVLKVLLAGACAVQKTMTQTKTKTRPFRKQSQEDEMR